jgi:hypothetical protein
MAGFQLTGHPDWQPVNSTPIPVLVAQLTGLASGVWGGDSVDVSSGGAYLLSVAPSNVSDTGCTDITVNHYDVLGNLVYTDFFGGVVSGSFPLGMPIYNGPTLVRGNIYGSVLKISGQTATTAFLNAVLSSSSAAASSVDINMYIIPNSLADPEPKVSNGNGDFATIGGAIPGGLLISAPALSLGPGVTSGPFPVTPYAGPASLIMNQTGDATTPNELELKILGYTVAAGGTIVLEQSFRNAVVTQTYGYDLDLAAYLNIYEIINHDGAQTSVSNITLIGQKSA